MCNILLPYVKHALNVRYKIYVKRMDWAPYVLCMFFYHTLYMRFEKHAFHAWCEKHALYISLKSLMLTYYNPCIKIVFFSKRTFNACSSKCMFYKTPVLRTFLDIRKTCVNEHTFKVAYNSGMFDNSHLLIMQYFFWTICENFLKDCLIPKRKWLNLSGLALQILKLFGI